MCKKILVNLLLFVSCSVSFAESTQIECKYDGNQQEMNACAVRDYQAMGSVLNKKYRKTLALLPANKKWELRREQRIWLSKLEPECKSIANKHSEGGSMWPLDYYGCLQSETEKRIKWLEKWKPNANIKKSRCSLCRLLSVA